ncbi:MAG: ribonuclease III domain-containing protein, partial [Bacillota bacterium]
AQAQALADLESFLAPEEADVARRARNIRVGRGPRSMPVLDYRHSTGFEAVIGYLYLLGRDIRLEELMSEALSLIEARLAKSDHNHKDKQ